MSGIIEIWRKEASPGLPVRFTVGDAPRLPDGNQAGEIIVKHIDFRETGSIAGKRLNEPVFCVTFENSFVQRFIPANQVVDVAYETKKADTTISTPPMEA